MSHALLGTNTVTAGSTTGGVTIGSAVPAGSLVALTVAWSNDTAAIPTISGTTDTRSNAYTVNASAGAGNSTVSCAIITSLLTTPLQAGDTITATITANRQRWVLQADSFSNVGAVDKTAVNDNPGSSAAMSTGTTAATTTANELLIACYGFGRGGSAVSTLDPGWSGGPMVTTAAGSVDRALQMGYRTVSATGTQQGTATLSVAAAYAGCIATFAVTSTPASAPLRGLRPQLRNLLVR